MKIVIDRTSGEIVELCGKDGNILQSPLRLNVWRAPTDNDINCVSKWRDTLLYAVQEAKEISFAVQYGDGKGLSCHAALYALGIL